MQVEEDQLPPSKTQRKKDAEAQQLLGKRLTKYTDQQLKILELPEKLLNALEEYHRLPSSHGARRRQLQFIGRVMRDCDTEKIEEAIAHLEAGSNSVSDKTKINAWLEKIDEFGATAIEEFIQSYPAADRQLLRQLHRNLSKAALDKKPVPLNKLRRYLSEITQES